MNSDDGTWVCFNCLAATPLLSAHVPCTVGNLCRSMQYVPCVVVLVFALRVVYSASIELSKGKVSSKGVNVENRGAAFILCAARREVA